MFYIDNKKVKMASKYKVKVPLDYQCLFNSVVLTYTTHENVITLTDALNYKKLLIKLKDEKFSDYFLTEPRVIEMDDNGFIELNADELKRLNNSKKLAFAGVGGSVEIWDSEMFDKEMESLTPERVAEMFRILEGEEDDTLQCTKK